MADVLEFKRSDPHAAGIAICIGCKNEWVQVAPVGVIDGFECTECGTSKGRFKYDFMPATGDSWYECSCGNQLFYIMPEGHLCANCGVYSRY